MCAEPYENAVSAKKIDAKFASFLRDNLNAHVGIAAHLAEKPVDGPQITHSMKKLRSMPVTNRTRHYYKHRIEEQRAWYRRNARIHRLQFRGWIAAIVITQGAAILLALLRIEFHEVWSVWPTAPLLILASSLLAWIQLKKFNQLASTYDLAEKDISLIETNVDHIQTERDLSKFVGDAELAFSREHILWVARRVT